MPIFSYEQYMSPETGKGKLAGYHDNHAETFSAAAEIPWGVAVQQNADDPNKVEVFNGAVADGFAGIAIADHFAGEYRVEDVSSDDITGTSYVAGQPISVLRRGIIWVQVLEDVIRGNKAVIDNETGNFRKLGSSETKISGVVGEFKTSAKANGLAQLEVNQPGYIPVPEATTP